MNKTVVHVETIEQWRSVLGIWFKQGYEWSNGGQVYSKDLFEDGGRFLFLDDYITYSFSNYDDKPFIEYSEFVVQQEKSMAKETYYVTQEQLDLINELNNNPYPANAINRLDNKKINILRSFSRQQDKALLRYVGGDTSIEFKVKEQLYRLWRIDDDKNRVYMRFNYGTPDWTHDINYAFIAPRENIEKHKTVSWEIEKAD